MPFSRALMELTDITVWVTYFDSVGGVKFGTPKTLKGRWEDKQMVVRDGAGGVSNSKARVFFPLNEEDYDQELEDLDNLPVGSFIYRGSSTAADPSTLRNPIAHRVVAISKIPDLREMHFLYRLDI